MHQWETLSYLHGQYQNGPISVGTCAWYLWTRSFLFMNLAILKIIHKYCWLVHTAEVSEFKFPTCTRLAARGYDSCFSAKGKVYVFKMLAYAQLFAVLANFAGIPTLFFQIVFSLESARSIHSMSMGACALVCTTNNVASGFWRRGVLINTNILKLCLLMYWENKNGKVGRVFRRGHKKGHSIQRINRRYCYNNCLY